MGTKTWRRTSWSSSASCRLLRLGGEARGLSYRRRGAVAAGQIWVLTAFAATIVLASVIAAAAVVAANAAAAALRRWLVVVSSTPSSAARSVIRRFCRCHRAIINTFAGGRCPLSPTFISHCSIALVLSIHHLHHSHRWLVVAFSARPSAYRLNHQADNVFMFPHLDLD